MNQILSIYKNIVVNPMSNIPSLLFSGVAMFGVVALFFSFITDLFTFPFILVAIISSLIAMWYIGHLGTLKENLEKMTQSVDMLKSNNDRLHNELNALQKLRQNLEMYAEKNNSDFQKVLEGINQSFQRLEVITTENERTLLYRIAQDLEFMDRKVGMNQDEYQRFIDRVPSHLQTSFLSLKNTTFTSIAGVDKKIDYKEIENLVTSIIKKDSTS